MERKFKNWITASNFPTFYLPALNEEITKNENIHHNYKHNDNWWFDFQDVVF